MNRFMNSKLLPFFAGGTGLTVLILRLVLFLLGRDEKGLLITGHPLDLLVWIVTAGSAALLLASVRKLGGSSRYVDNFAPSAAAAIGTFALAGGIVVASVLGSASGYRLELLCCISGMVATVAIIWVGICRYQGKRPFFLCHAAVCLYLTLYTIGHYQIWSSHPQIQDWFFSMAGIVCLALFSYHQTAFDAGLGKRRLQLAVGLLGGFFCLTAAADGTDLLLYTGGAIWSLTNLCSLMPAQRRRRNPITEPEKDSTNETA